MYLPSPDESDDCRLRLSADASGMNREFQTFWRDVRESLDPIDVLRI